MAIQPQRSNQKTLGQAVGQAATNVFNRTLGRLFGAGLNKGAEKGIFGGNPSTARWTTRSGSTDWRVKLTIPSDSDLLNQMFFQGSNKNAAGGTYNLLGPLVQNNGIIFPITPSVIIQHTANYQQLATTHANYPYYAYQNSEPANLTIIGEFPVQNQTDAEHWVATIHFLRAVTKMFFGGEDQTRGNPPPILQFNGYGNHVFKNVPVIVTNFTCELRSDVDYIATSQGSGSMRQASKLPDAVRGTDTLTLNQTSELPATWAPSLSTITVQIQPIYSRDTVKSFSMKDFVSGKLYNGPADKQGTGFI